MLAVDESVHASTHLINTSQLVCQTRVQLQHIHLPAQFHPQSDHLLERTRATMDDLMEMFAMPSWPEINNMGKLPWDYNGGNSASTMSSNDTGSSLSAPQKTFPTSGIPSSMLGSSMGRQNPITLGHGGQDAAGHLNSNEPGIYYSEELMLAARLSQQHVNQDGFIGSADVSSMAQSQIDGRIQLLPHGMQETARSVLRRISEGTCRAPSLNRSPSIGSSSVGSEISSCQQLSSDNPSPSSINPGWRQSYMGGVLPSQLALGQVKTEPLMTVEGTQNEPHLMGKRFRDDDLSSRAAPQENMFSAFSGAQVQQIRSAGQQIQMQVSAAPFPSHTGIGQSQGAAAVVAGTARPRVRARRGQATDPHSIAERLRRERIADRMKALQELVPHANKTDKASMLDEIIEYVRFLQLQVKVLSVSRIGVPGAVGPLVADVSTEGHMHFAASALYPTAGASASSQDNITATEQQVARMMEDDMGAALQFLQKKGLCLMPVTLATTISGSGTRPSTGGQSGLPRRTDTLTSTITANTNAIAGGMLMPAAAHLGEIAADQGRESAIQPSGAPSGQSSCTLINGAKVHEETGKTSSL